MGSGYIYSCDKCKESYSIYLGVGMMYFEQYRGIANQIKKGKLGEEYQSIIKSDKKIVIDADNVVYLCNHCGNWNVEPVLDLYELKAAENLSVEKSDYVQGFQNVIFKFPSVVKSDNYKLLKKYIHKCSKCGKRTRKLDTIHKKEIPCPKCRSVMMLSGVINWD